MTTYILCHGWALSASSMADVQALLPEKKVLSWNLGYYGERHVPMVEEPVVGIGYSWGLVSLLKSGMQFSHLISLNGFVNFLGGFPYRHEELETFKQNFQQDSNNTIKFFQKSLDIVETGTPDLDLLWTDLCGLGANYSDLLEQHKGKISIIYGASDTVLPYEIVMNNFSQHKICSVAGTHKIGPQMLNAVRKALNDDI